MQISSTSSKSLYKTQLLHLTYLSFQNIKEDYQPDISECFVWLGDAFSVTFTFRFTCRGFTSERALFPTGGIYILFDLLIYSINAI